MKALVKALTGVFVLAAALAGGSGAAMSAPSGDTCTVNGSGTSYTIVINIPPTGPEQGAFAIGAAGRTIGTITMPNDSGTLSTTGVPANASAAWIMDGKAVPGSSLTASVKTNGAVSGVFTVVPANLDRTTWFDAVVCSFPKGTPVPSNKFTAQKKATYSATTGTWRAAVIVPGPGKLNFVHKTLAAGGTPKPLIKSGKLSVGKAGKVMLTLRPTAAGMAALTNGGKINLSLNIEFSPTNGTPANKVVSLTLRK